MGLRRLAAAGAAIGVLVLGGVAAAQDLDLMRAAIAGATDHGLEKAQDARLLAGSDEAALSQRFADLVGEQMRGRVSPRTVDHRWAYSVRTYDAASAISAARQSGGLDGLAREAAAPGPRYVALLEARRRYVRIVAQGGWPVVPGVAPLRPGATDARVAALRARLAAEGYETGAGQLPQVYDAGLAEAVRLFQARSGLTPDAVVGGRTLAALNVTAKTRLAQITANLERWRWLPRQLPPDRVEVNVPAAELAYVQDGRTDFTMRVVVGAPKTATPLFVSALSSIVFNPPWNVPDSIAIKEILPKARANPSYLSRNGYRYVDGRLQQKPGPESALGLIKFDFDSPFGVYLHDTPSKSAFLQDRRYLSHGCIRLGEPRRLADQLLGLDGWTSEQVGAAIATGRTQRVGLQRSRPLYLLYFTAFVDEAGVLHFREDPYGWDAKLLQAMQAKAAR